MAASKQNFLNAHWDKLVMGVGLAMLGVSVVFLMPELSTSPEDGAASYERRLKAMTPAHEGVPAANLTVLETALRTVKAPPKLQEVDPKKSNFLVSQRRVLCQKGDTASVQEACGKPIPADSEICPLCGMKQNVVKVEVDTDGDGLPNDWEKKYGLNPNDPSDANVDSDNDGFTNAEEFAAKTNPKDPEDHPDYLDSLAVEGELKQTTLPFYFNGDVMPLPGNTYRVTLQRLGKTGYDAKFTAKIGEEIASSDGKVKTGWKVASYEKKTEQRVVKGTGKSALKKSVDVSIVTVERVKDGKKIPLVTGAKSNTVESQAELVYRRGDEKRFTVSVGSEIELNGRKYTVKNLRQTAQGCEATMFDQKTKKEKVLR